MMEGKGVMDQKILNLQARVAEASGKTPVFVGDFDLSKPG